MNYELQNGLRLIVDTVPGARVDYFGVAVRCGSRNDPQGMAGLSHFLEHTIFKGTERRHSFHINQRMEAVGGELNAFTTKEVTTVYTVAPRGNLARSAELVADLVAHSQFPETELAKERQVVGDEIDSYRDSPADAVFDDFQDLLFAGSDLGHNILGTRRTVSRHSSEACRAHLQRFYRPSRMVAYYNGAVGAERVRQVVERYFGAMSDSDDSLSSTLIPPIAEPFDLRRHNHTHQANTVMGTRVCPYGHEDMPALKLLTDILGGPGMNSRLNTALRERRGLVYGVDASLDLYSDAGAFMVSYACDPDDDSACREIVRSELQRLCQEPLNTRQLAAAKKQYLGQMILAAENRDNTASGTATAMLLTGKVMTDSEWRDRIRALTSADLQTVAQRYLDPQRLSILTLG